MGEPTSMARGRLSPRLRLSPTTMVHTDSDTGLGYHGLGYRGYYYGKREAEAEPKAEADPYLLYGGLRTYGYGLGYYGLGHHGVYYGKREAEATPKAEADPYLLYGGYGLGYGHLGYGY